HGAKRDDCFGTNNFNLPHEKWRAGLTLITLWRSIARRAALDDIGDVDFFAAQAHGFDHIGQQLPGAADERLALFIFISARSFANEHQIGSGIAYAENNLLASLFVQAAAGAVADVFANLAKRNDGIGRYSGLTGSS